MLKKLLAITTIASLSVSLLATPTLASEEVRNTVEWTEGTEAFKEIGFSDEMIDELINLEEGESISNENPKSKDLTYTTSTLVSTDWGVTSFIQYHPDPVYGQPNFYIGMGYSYSKCFI